MSLFSRQNIASKNNITLSRSSIIHNFSALDGSKKVALMDCLSSSRKNFYKTVTLFWPEAKEKDCRKLEAFLVSCMAANDD